MIRAEQSCATTRVTGIPVSTGRQGVGGNEEVDDRGRWKIAVKMSFLSFPWSSASRGGEAGQGCATGTVINIIKYIRVSCCSH